MKERVRVREERERERERERVHLPVYVLWPFAFACTADRLNSEKSFLTKSKHSLSLSLSHTQTAAHTDALLYTFKQTHTYSQTNKATNKPSVHEGATDARGDNNAQTNFLAQVPILLIRLFLE